MIRKYFFALLIIGTSLIGYAQYNGYSLNNAVENFQNGDYDEAYLAAQYLLNDGDLYNSDSLLLSYTYELYDKINECKDLKQKGELSATFRLYDDAIYYYNEILRINPGDRYIPKKISEIQKIKYNSESNIQERPVSIPSILKYKTVGIFDRDRQYREFEICLYIDSYDRVVWYVDFGDKIHIFAVGSYDPKSNIILFEYNQHPSTSNILRDGPIKFKIENNDNETVIKSVSDKAKKYFGGYVATVSKQVPTRIISDELAGSTWICRNGGEEVVLNFKTPTIVEIKDPFDDEIYSSYVLLSDNEKNIIGIAIGDSEAVSGTYRLGSNVLQLYSTDNSNQPPFEFRRKM